MIDELCKNLRKDPELYYAYQANIAMAFKDEVYRLGPVTRAWNRQLVHEIANQAAKNFLDLLIKPREIEVDKNMLRKLLDQGDISMEECLNIKNQLEK